MYDRSWVEKLTPEEREAILIYVSSGTDINDELRYDMKKQSKIYAKLVKNLDSAIKKGPTFKGFFYKGIDPTHLKNFKVGDVFHEKGYLSVTDTRSIAQRFARRAGRYGIVAIIKVLNVKGIVPEYVSYASEIEDEVLLQRNTKLKFAFIESDEFSINRLELHVSV